jgi:hypothetical protein
MDENAHPIREDWWTPDQIELVEDVSRYWIKARFVTVPGVWIPMNGGRVRWFELHGHKILLG